MDSISTKASLSTSTGGTICASAAAGNRRPAAAKLAARAERVATIRKRVALGALAVFVAGWMLIAVTMASGIDAVLSTKGVNAASAASAASAAPVGDGGFAPPGFGAADPGPQGVSPVTTRQS
jgi:hypothetical protein